MVPVATSSVQSPPALVEPVSLVLAATSAPVAAASAVISVRPDSPAPTPQP